MVENAAEYSTMLFEQLRAPSVCSEAIKASSDTLNGALVPSVWRFLGVGMEEGKTLCLSCPPNN